MPINKKGFTLLELLIVIAIIAILAVIVILVLNPAETLKKARDERRMSDLNTIKSALSLYAHTTSSPLFGVCKTGTGWIVGNKIYYSAASDTLAITSIGLDGGISGSPSAGQVSLANLGNTNGAGWIPVNLDSLSGGSPIANFPIDPVNTIVNAAAPANTDLVYRYACKGNDFEIDARLESDAYTSVDNKMANDGGDNNNLYEVGTNLKILGSGAF